MSESQGGGAILYFVNGISLIQTITPDALLGRVNASRRFAVWGVIPAGQVRTVLIADVRGYTRFTVERGDEAAAALAALFAALTRDVASAHEGQVLELRGDEALAVFTSAGQALAG